MHKLLMAATIRFLKTRTRIQNEIWRKATTIYQNVNMTLATKGENVWLHSNQIRNIGMRCLGTLSDISHGNDKAVVSRVYGGPSTITTRRINARDLPLFAKRIKECRPNSFSNDVNVKESCPKRLVCVTAYDYPSAVAGDSAGADILLVKSEYCGIANFFLCKSYHFLELIIRNQSLHFFNEKVSEFDCIGW